jgi:glycerate kinase
VAACIAEGLKKAIPDVEVLEIPMADGGEGTVETLVAATGGQIISCDVTGPLGEKIRKARLGILGEANTAVIEMAASSGLALVPPEKRNPLNTTTFGTGELIRAALDRGVGHLIIGIGGSATVDGGAGMAQALGAQLLDKNGQSIGFGGGELANLDKIDLSTLDSRVAKTEVIVASDVTNPLVGENGAARIFGPQKGATPEMVETLEKNLHHLSEIIERDVGIKVGNRFGAGAAGGLGAGLVAFLGAKIRRGINVVLQAARFRERIGDCDLIITGEGRIDRQSVFGKTAVGVARAAKGLNLPVIAIVGSVGDGADEVLSHGVDAYFSILSKPMNLEEAFASSPQLIVDCAAQVGRVVHLFADAK